MHCVYWATHQRALLKYFVCGFIEIVYGICNTMAIDDNPFQMDLISAFRHTENGEKRVKLIMKYTYIMLIWYASAHCINSLGDGLLCEIHCQSSLNGRKNYIVSIVISVVYQFQVTHKSSLIRNRLCSSRICHNELERSCSISEANKVFGLW